jgi:hypothetical protein
VIMGMSNLAFEFLKKADAMSRPFGTVLRHYAANYRA